MSKKQNDDPSPRGSPPGAWQPARRLARRAIAPVERFLSIEASSGVLILMAAALALGWANSPWRASYTALFHVPVGMRVGRFAFERDLHFWINDGIMTVFFFVVGLEIRRELRHGELSEPRRAALPLAAAIGGMSIPTCIYAALNVGHETVRGWGVPMATDIAFAVGVLALLGKRVPAALRILLLALAVIDDLGAILVIALFYSSGLSGTGLLVLAAGLGVVRLLQMIGVRNAWAYVPPSMVAWAGALAAGVHPTLVGVLVGLMTPADAWFGRKTFVERVDASVAAVRDDHDDDERAILPHLEHLDEARREAISPVERLQHALHGLVAFGVMPLFALANAGVSLGHTSSSASSRLVFGGVALGLVLGKPIGVLAFSWLATRIGIAALPRGVTWLQIGVVGVVAGIGFTMSIFIASLAFPSDSELETAKIGVLVASGIAAISALLLGRLALPANGPSDCAASESEAEASTAL